MLERFVEGTEKERECVQLKKKFGKTLDVSYTILKGPLKQKTCLCTDRGKERREQEQRHRHW